MLAAYVRLLALSAVTTRVIKCYKVVTTILLPETDAPLRVTGPERKKERNIIFTVRDAFLMT